MRSSFIARLSMIILALLIGLVGGVTYAASAGNSNIAATLAAARQPTPLIPTPTLVLTPTPADRDTRNGTTYPETDPFIRTELFFGSERTHQPEVSAAEFKQFLDTEVTPRFPDGLTLLTGFGQFREANGEIVQETSFVLILLYPRETASTSSAKIEEIRTLYIEQFDQESVLRVDDPRPVRVSF